MSPDSNSSAVQIHQLSRGKSQSPFKKSIGLVQKVIFHPLRPYLLVAVSFTAPVFLIDYYIRLKDRSVCII